MGNTTIRVDAETHRLLLELSSASGETVAATTRLAAEALWRDRLAGMVANEIEALRSNPGAWEDYLAEAESTHVTDGLD